jgi:hypothetical protein
MVECLIYLDVAETVLSRLAIFHFHVLHRNLRLSRAIDPGTDVPARAVAFIFQVGELACNLPEVGGQFNFEAAAERRIGRLCIDEIGSRLR